MGTWTTTPVSPPTPGLVSTLYSATTPVSLPMPGLLSTLYTGFYVCEHMSSAVCRSCRVSLVPCVARAVCRSCRVSRLPCVAPSVCRAFRVSRVPCVTQALRRRTHRGGVAGRRRWLPCTVPWTRPGAWTLQ